MVGLCWMTIEEIQSTKAFQTYDTPTFVAIEKFRLPHRRVTENSSVTPTTGTKNFWSMQIFNHHMVCDWKFLVTQVLTTKKI